MTQRDREMGNSSGDVFRDKVTAFSRSADGQSRARQSLGRDMSSQEEALADALMQIYADGIHDPDAVADSLNRLAVPLVSGKAGTWTADLLHRELQSLNADLDAAYEKNGHAS